jgi:hypothetical protein
MGAKGFCGIRNLFLWIIRLRFLYALFIWIRVRVMGKYMVFNIVAIIKNL